MKKVILHLITILLVSCLTNCDSSSSSEQNSPDNNSTTTMVVDDGGYSQQQNNESYQFDTTRIENMTSVTFYIRNYGLSALILKKFPELTDNDQQQFIIDTSSTSLKISKYTYTTFTIHFNPTDLGKKTAKLKIFSNDEDDPDYTLHLEAIPIIDKTTLLDSDEEDFVDSQIIADKNNIYIAYHHYISLDESSLKFAKSTDAGKTWNIKKIDPAENVGKYPSMCVNDSTIYISYADSGNHDFKFAKSTDAGESFSCMTISTYLWPLSNSMYIKPDKTNGDDIYIAVSGFTTYLVISYDGGQTWDQKLLSDKWSDDIFFSMDKNNNMLCSFTQTTSDLTKNTYILSSTDDGDTWSEYQVDFSEEINNMGLFITPNNEIYNISRILPSDFHWNLVLSKSTDGGRNWTSEYLTDEDKNKIEATSLDIHTDSKGNLYIFYNDGGLILLKSTDYGNTWQKTYIDDPSDDPDVFIDENDIIYISYTDSLYDGGYRYRLNFLKSADGGLTWE